MTDTTDHPPRRAGLRDEIAQALEAADYRLDMRRGDLADAIMPVLYREWPWLRAEAEEAAASVVVPAADRAAPELTAEEARALAEDLGYQLYRAQDALAFVGECCDLADREQRPVTTADVREWLKGARCGRQLAVDAADRAALRDRIAAALWQTVEHDIVAEWICCEPIDPSHTLCVQGGAAMRMIKSLIFDGDRTLADVALAVLPAPADRAAVLRDFVSELDERLLGCCQECNACAAIARDLAAELADEAAVGRVAAETPPAETAAVRLSEELCPGFPDRCPNLRTVEPEQGVHLGGVRCGCADDPAPAVEAQPGKDTETLRCNHAHLREPHRPHGWEPQPGMDPVHCPGFTAEQQPKEA